MNQEKYIGMDVHQATISLTLNGPNGEGNRASSKVCAFLLLTPCTPSRRAAFLFQAS